MTLLSTVAPWDLVAEGYTDTTMRMFQGYVDAALELVPLNGGSRVADIACGPGTLSFEAAKRAASVKALDFSENMLAMLQKGMVEQGIDNIEPYQGDGQELPFDDCSFDAAFSMFGLMFFPDRPKGFAELFRTLKPGGRVCVSSWASIDRSPMMAVMFDAMKKIKPDLPDPKQDLGSLENPDVLAAEVRDAGFTDVVVHHVTKSSEIKSAQHAWDDMVKGSAPVQMLKRAMPEQVWRERSTHAVNHIAKSIGPVPASLSSTAYLGVGTK